MARQFIFWGIHQVCTDLYLNSSGFFVDRDPEDRLLFFDRLSAVEYIQYQKLELCTVVPIRTSLEDKK